MSDNESTNKSSKDVYKEFKDIKKNIKERYKIQMESNDKFNKEEFDKEFENKLNNNNFKDLNQGKGENVKNIYYCNRYSDTINYNPKIKDLEKKMLYVIDSKKDDRFDSLNVLFNFKTDNLEIDFTIASMLNKFVKTLNNENYNFKDLNGTKELTIFPKSIVLQFEEARGMLLELNEIYDEIENKDSAKLLIKKVFEKINENENCKFGIGFHSFLLNKKDHSEKDVELRYTLFIDIPKIEKFNYKNDDTDTPLQVINCNFDLSNFIRNHKVGCRRLTIFPFIGAYDNDDRIEKICEIFGKKSEVIKAFFDKGDDEEEYELTEENFKKFKL